MSGPAKDDKKDEKKSLPAKLIGISLGILAIWVFLAVSGVTLPGAFNQGAQTATDTGVALNNLARGSDRLASGGSAVVGSWVKIIVGALVLFLIGREIGKMLKGGGHDDHAHPPPVDKPVEKKPDDKAKAKPDPAHP